MLRIELAMVALAAVDTVRVVAIIVAGGIVTKDARQINDLIDWAHENSHHAG